MSAKTESVGSKILECPLRDFFADINNELIFRSKLILQNTRNYYYNTFYPKGYFFIKDKPKVSAMYKENAKQYYYRRSLYNRKMMKK